MQISQGTGREAIPPVALLARAYRAKAQAAAKAG
jgi:hypothetical protein